MSDNRDLSFFTLMTIPTKIAYLQTIDGEELEELINSLTRKEYLTIKSYVKNRNSGKNEYKILEDYFIESSPLNGYME